MDVCLLILIGTCCLLQDVQSIPEGPEYDLHHTLFTGYNRNIRPVRDPREPVYVFINFVPQSILGLNEKDEILKMNGLVTAEWVNEFLVWEPQDYSGLRHIVISPDQIWLPDFALMNSAKTFYQKTYLEDFKVVVDAEGFSLWQYGGIFETSCSLDMTYYPFDVQKCDLIFENWAYHSDSVLLLNESANMDTDNLPEENGLWRFKNSEVVSNIFAGDEEFADKSYPRVTFTLYLERMRLYYIINIFCPCVFILCIALGMFFLPADSGEKVSLGITVLLAFSVFQLVIMENTPQSSVAVPLLTKFVMGIMGITTFSVLTSITVIFLHLKSSRVRPPYCLRLFFLKGVATVLCMRRYMPDDATPVAKQIDPLKVENVEATPTINKKIVNDELNPMVQMLKELKRFNERLDDKEREESVQDEWKAMGKVIDRLCFWLCVLGAAILAIVLFVPQDVY